MEVPHYNGKKLKKKKKVKQTQKPNLLEYMKVGDISASVGGGAALGQHRPSTQNILSMKPQTFNVSNCPTHDSYSEKKKSMSKSIRFSFMFIIDI